MKKLSGVFICLLLFTFISSARIIEVADAGITDKLKAVIAAKNAGGAPAAPGADCSGVASFIWEIDDESVDGAGECVESGGDSSATKTGSPSISTSIANFPNVSDYYSFDISSNDLVSDNSGTIYIKVRITAWGNYAQLFKAKDAATDDVVTCFQKYTDEFTCYYFHGGTAREIDTAGDFSTGTWYIIAYTWTTQGTPSNDSQVDVYNADCSSNLYSEALDVGLDTMTDTMTELQIGNSQAANASDFDIDYVHIYTASDYSAHDVADPNGDCTSPPAP